MYDIITLRGLSASGLHGVYDFEQSTPQPFVVDVAMWVNIQAAAQSDSIDLTVSYADVAQDIMNIVCGPSVRLIETLADRIAEHIMFRPMVAGVQVVVHKPQAPMDVDFADVSVTVRRGYTDARINILGNVEATDTESTGESPAVTPQIEYVTVGEPLSTDPSGEAFLSTQTIEMELIPATYEAMNGDEASPTALEAALPAEHASDQPVKRVAPVVSMHSAEESVTDFVLAFGGNLGNVPVTLVKALERLIDIPQIEIRDVSPLLRTAAVVKPGMEPQADHWNMVALGRTTLTPHDLLAATLAIEAELGRERPFEWAPRTIDIDIDIITMGDHQVDDEVLQLPHPRAYGRAFVLLPWLLVDPEAYLPGYGVASELIGHTPDRNGVRDLIDVWYENPDTVMADSDAVVAADHSAMLDPTVTDPCDAGTAEAAQHTEDSHTLSDSPAVHARASREDAVGPDESASQAQAGELAPQAEVDETDPAADEQVTAEEEPAVEQAPASKPRVSVRPVRDFAAEWAAFEKRVTFEDSPLLNRLTRGTESADTTTAGTDNTTDYTAQSSTRSSAATTGVPSAITPSVETSTAGVSPLDPQITVDPPMAVWPLAHVPTNEPSRADAEPDRDTPSPHGYYSAHTALPTAEHAHSAYDNLAVHHVSDAPATTSAQDTLLGRHAQAASATEPAHAVPSATASDPTPTRLVMPEWDEAPDTVDAAERVYQAPTFDEALEFEKPLVPQSGVSWIPVSTQASSQAPTNTPGATPTLGGQDDASHNALSAANARPLPAWNFAQSQVTIIDSVDEAEQKTALNTTREPDSDTVTDTAQVTEAAGLDQVSLDASAHDITVDPNLPQGTEIGALDTGNTPRVTISRKGIFRPTHTGAMPVVKRDS